MSEWHVRLDAQLAAREHDRGAVLADRLGDEDAVARLEGAGAERRARVDLADSRGADVHAVGEPPFDDLGVAGDDRDADVGRGAGDRIDLPP